MSDFKTVAGFLQAVPRAMEHEAIYRRYVSEAASREKKESVDLAAWEYSLVGVGERNVLRDMIMQDKFVMPGMDAGFKMESSSWAKQSGSDVGKGSLSNSEEYSEDFLMPETICLETDALLVSDSSRPGVQIPNNEPLYRQLMATLKGVSPAQMSGIALSFIGEKLVSKQDLRKIMLKGYLMTQSYNLAVSSGIHKFQHSDMSVKVMEGYTPETKVAELMTGGIVVDVKHFTDEQIAILIEMCDEYPKKRFGEANIYNNIYISEDRLTLLGRKGYKPPAGRGYGSPERLWANIIDIAMKFGALNDLGDVVKDFRGMPGIMRQISVWTGKDTFHLEYPYSYSVKLGIMDPKGGVAKASKYSGYFSTTKSLVSDLLVSSMMTMSVFSLLEEIGALTSIGIPSGEPMHDPLFNSVLRNRGLRSDDEQENQILNEWKAIRSGSTKIAFGGKLKKMVVKMAEMIYKDKIEWMRPQLLFAIPYSTFVNTTWGSIRNWRFDEFDFGEGRDRKVKSNFILKAYTWVMGVSKDIPMVGLNAADMDVCEALSNRELDFVSLASGSYQLKLVRHRIVGDVRPRTDEIEKGSELFYKSGFPGTRCTIMFDSSGDAVIVVESYKPDEITVTSVIAGSANAEKEVVTHGGSKAVVPGGPAERQGAVENRELRNARQIIRDKNGGTSDENDGSRDERQKEKDTEGKRKQSESRTDQPIGEGGKEGEGEAGKETEGLSEVIVLKEPVLDFREKAMVSYDKEHRPIGVRAKLHTGQEMVFFERANKIMPEEASVRGYKLETPGDGFCGLHAVINNLVVHGFIPQNEKVARFHEGREKMVNRDYYEAIELAAYCNSLDMGLVVLDPRNKVMQRYGTLGSRHNVWVEHDGRNHWSTFIPNSEGPDKYEGYRFVMEEVPPDVMLRGLEDAKLTLGGNAAMEKFTKQKTDETFFGGERSGRGGSSRGNRRGGGRSSSDSSNEREGGSRDFWRRDRRY